MACLREAPIDGRIGTVSCHEEGCLFRHVTADGGKRVVKESSKTDCLLQLRLRVGATEDSDGAIGQGRVWNGENWQDIEFYISQAQYDRFFKLDPSQFSIDTKNNEPIQIYKGRPVDRDDLGEGLEPGRGAEEGVDEEPSGEPWIVDMSAVFAVRVDGRSYHPNDVEFLIDESKRKRD